MADPLFDNLESGFNLHSSIGAEVGEAGAEGTHTVLLANDETILIMRDHVIAMEMERCPGIEAAYVASDEHGGIIVYAVTDQSDDALYGRIVDAEDALAERLKNCQIECRIRERQGRPASSAVPVSSEPVWVR